MDQYPNLNASAARAVTTSAGTAAAAAMAPAKPLDPLRFPGEDEGRSLTAWARRDLEATLQLLADRAQYITGGSGAAIALRDGEHIICRASSGPSAPEVGSYLQVSSGLSGESVRTRKILSCDNASVDPRVNHDSCRALGIASFVVMPLVRENEVVGIFEIFSAQPHAFQERDLQALERMGEMVNTALDQVMNPKHKPGLVTGATQKVPIVPKQPAVTPPSVPPPSIAVEKKIQPAVTPAVVSQPTTSAAPSAPPTPNLAPAAQEPAAKGENRQIAVDREGTVPPTPAVGTCASCGFPVSPGRAFCLDCEASLPEKFGDSPAKQAPATPAFLTDLGDGGPAPSGVKQWIIAHRYLLGTILVLGGTAALLLFR